jgi:hypothetical protein
MGKIVVKKIQSQASTTAFQIPSTDGTTGQVIKTDGSGNLGWTDKSASIGSAGINYTMPAADGTAGKILQTDGTTGNLEFVTPGVNPFTTPDGAHQGLRLCDKYFAGLNDASNVSSVTLTVPAAYTTTPSDVLCLELQIIGSSTSGAGGGVDSKYRIYPVAQDGTTSTRSTADAVTAIQGYSNRYYNTNTSNSSGQNGTNNSGGSIPYFNVGKDYQAYNYGSSNTRWNGSRGTSFQYHPHGHWNFTWWNAQAYPQWWGKGSQGRTGFQADTRPNQASWHKSINPSTSEGFHKSSPTNVTHSMGLKIDWTPTQTIVDGVFLLFARFKDGVVS